MPEIPEFASTTRSGPRGVRSTIVADRERDGREAAEAAFRRDHPDFAGTSVL
jgi:hypothetical protein